jgi:hypothetical protein
LTGRPRRVRIDRLVLRNVDEHEIGDLRRSVAEELERSDASGAPAEPVPRGPDMGAAIARSVAASIRTRMPRP